MQLNQKRQILLLVALSFVAIICVMSWIIWVPINVTDVSTVDGFWDLRSINFVETVVRLQGDVEYIAGELLTPEQFAKHESEALFGNTSRLGVVTSRIRIYLPGDSWYTFSHSLLSRASRIYVNGEWLFDIGTIGEDQETIILSSECIIFTARPIDGVVEIVQQSVTHLNRWETTGLGQNWYIGNQRLISNIRSTNFVSSLIMGCFFTMFLIFIMWYFLQRDYTVSLYFALLSLTLFLFTGVVGPNMFLAVFPWFDWQMKFRLEYIAISMVMGLNIAVINEIIPWLFHKFFCRVFYMISAIFILVFFFMDIAKMGQFAIFLYLCALFICLYLIFQGIRKFRKINLEQGIFLVGLFLVALSNLHDLNYQLGIFLIPFSIDLPFLFTIAYIYLFYCLAAVVFISNMKAMRIAQAAEQKLAAENTALTQLNHMKTDLMTTISHEARTPLAVLASYAGLVAMKLSSQGGSEETIANLDKITKEAKRVASLIDSMKLTLNKEKPKKHSKVNLTELIEKTAKLYHHIFERDDIEMDLVLDDELFVLGNSSELTQILFNILQNAKDHTEQGKISITAKKEDDSIVVTLSDTGTGIPSELIPKLFERGISGTKFGMGIGLPLCKEIMEAHDGMITVESELNGENRGTRIILTFFSSYQVMAKNKI